MIEEWLARWQARRLSGGHEAYRVPLPGYPELHVEKLANKWVMAFELGPLPGNLSMGTLLLLLGTNSPYGSVTVTVDQSGSLILYSTLPGVHVEIAQCEQHLAMLCDHHAFLEPELRPIALRASMLAATGFA